MRETAAHALWMASGRSLPINLRVVRFITCSAFIALGTPSVMGSFLHSVHPQQTKRPPEGGLSSSDRLWDQAMRSIAVLRRRYAMKPTPAKPRIIIAQVDGSGTAETESSN